MENIHLYWKSIVWVFILLMGFYSFCKFLAKRKVELMLTKDESIVETWQLHFIFRWVFPICIALIWGYEIPNMINIYPVFGFQQYFLLIFIFIFPTLLMLSLMTIHIYITSDYIVIISSFDFLNKNPGLKNLGKTFYFKNMENLKLDENARGIKFIEFNYEGRIIQLGSLKNTALYYKHLLHIMNIA